MNDYHGYLSPGNFYHIYNRGNNKENLFLNEGNYLKLSYHRKLAFFRFITAFDIKKIDS